MNPISVSELTKQIKEILADPGFQNIAVEGELSNFVHHTSGHMYFSLKDKQSRIKAVMFRSRNQRLGFVPKNGDTLIAVGSLGVYEANGEYQLYVDLLLSRGIGDLHQAFEQLKIKLEAEGLFAVERKRSLPYLPQKIGVVTSPTGAALRDIIHVLQRRYPGVKVLVFPALVQGEAAPSSLRQALTLAQNTDVDLIILGRGGGSFEELAAFNDEELARAIARSAIPVISAVGHETDFTIADYVADLRAPTPSAAAELAVPLQEELVATITKLQERMSATLTRQINADRRYLKQLSHGPALQQPYLTIRQLRQKVDELWTKLGRYNLHRIEIQRAQLGSQIGKLETLSPLKTLHRGYAICQDQEGQIINRVDQISLGAVVGVRLHKGRLLCKVEGREANHE